jgi:hypothetical protein
LLRFQRSYGNRFVQRVVDLSRQGVGEASVTPEVEHAIQAARGGGQALDSGVRAQMEPTFGANFSNVRVHSDSQADNLNHTLSARAFTTGQHIFFRRGEYRPGSSSGRELLAHELTHVVQQHGQQARTRLALGAPGDRYEQEADSVARAVAQQDGQMRRQAVAEEAKARPEHFHAAIATAGGERLEDEPYMVATKPALNAHPIVSPLRIPRIGADNVSLIQRAANFVAGTVSATTNMAAHIIAGNMNAGFTPPTLNGTQILSAAAARGAIRAPTLSGRSNIDGTVDTWVESVPTNEASFTMQLPTNGPWSTTTAKANVATVFAALGLTTPAGCSTAGDTTFSVHGQPSDADFAANVRTHEDLHAADHRTGFSAVIVPWDTKLQAAQTAGNRV